jgi:hypothetical protein
MPAKTDPNDGYYEGMAHICAGEGTFTDVRVSLLTETMVKLFGNEDESEFIISLKTKSTHNKFTTRFRFVNIPPSDARETLRQEKRKLANQALMAAEAEERKQAALHPAKRLKPTPPAVTQARAALLAVDAPPSPDLCTTIRIKYRQTEAPTCLIDSFCSAIWEFGLCEAAKDLQANHRMRLVQTNVELIAAWVNTTNRKYLHSKGMVIRKMKNLGTVDQVLAWDTSWPLVVLLKCSDGGVGQHSVTIYNDGIYEPNSTMVLTKSRQALDWASGVNCTCIGIWKAYQIVPLHAGQLTDGPPRIYNVKGHGRGWLLKSKPTYVRVQLFSGDSIKVDKTLLGDIA